MKDVEKAVYEVLEIQRSTVGIKKYDSNTAVLLLLGYCDSENISDKVNLEKILDSQDMGLAIKDALRVIGKEVEELKDVIPYLDNLHLPNEVIGKIIVTLKRYLSNAEQYRLALGYMMEKVDETSHKLGGDATTPDFINKLAVEIVESKDGEFYDGVLGLGGSAIAANEFAKRLGNELKIYGQEINIKNYALAKVRLFMNGIDCTNIRIGNMLSNPCFVESKTTLKKFDSIIMCPPFSLRWKDIEEEISNDKYGRFVYGTPTVSSADWLFISSALKSLKENGRAVIITTLGTLFRGGAESSLRSKLLGFDYIESIIELPSGLFANTGIASAMIIFNMNKGKEMRHKIQFIDAAEIYEQVRRGKRILSDKNVNKILDIYRNKSEVEELCSIVELENIEGSNILPSRYVIKTKFESSEYGKVKINLDNLKTSKVIGDMADFYRGINVTSKNIQDPNGNYKIINLADIKGGELDLNSMPSYTIENNARVEAYKVEAGDIIISSRGTTKIGIIPEHEGEVLISQNFIGIRPKGGNNPKYIKEFLESPLGEYLIESRKTGTAVATINLKDFKALPMVDVDTEKQDKIINEYVKQEKEFTKQMQELQAKIDNLKFDLYDKMEMRDLFEIL